ARGCRTAAKGVWFRLINKGCGCRTAARGCRTAAIRACLFRGTAATIRAAFGSGISTRVRLVLVVIGAFGLGLSLTD
nr:hypothetical protein [Tanacetum cinerariifolium]